MLPGIYQGRPRGEEQAARGTRCEKQGARHSGRQQAAGVGSSGRRPGSVAAGDARSGQGGGEGVRAFGLPGRIGLGCLAVTFRWRMQSRSASAVSSEGTPSRERT